MVVVRFCLFNYKTRETSLLFYNENKKPFLFLFIMSSVTPKRRRIALKERYLEFRIINIQGHHRCCILREAVSVPVCELVSDPVWEVVIDLFVKL